MIANEILNLLLERHGNKREWVCFKEFMVSPASYGGGIPDECISERRIDMFAMNMFRCKKFLRIAYEIKVSRADFLSDIKDMRKHEPILNFCNEFWFATPKGLVTPEEVPAGLGLMEFTEGNKYPKFIVKPMRKETLPPGWPFIASVCRRIQKGESHYLSSLKDKEN